MKLKLIFASVLIFAGMAQAQGGFLSNLSVGVGFQGVLPAATFNRNNTDNYLSTAQYTTKSVGAVADARYDFGRHSALGFAVTVNRNSELFFNSSQVLYRTQSNNAEMIGSYIFRLPSNERVKPYALFGGGLVRFSPNDANNLASLPSASTKAAFAYGFGTDFKMSDHLALRLQYRGLLRNSPDFKVSGTDAFGTGLKTHVAEPSIQLVYHFL